MLLTYTSVAGSVTEDFRKHVHAMVIYGDPAVAAAKKAMILDNFAAKLDKFIDAQVEIYDRLLSEDALDAAIAFYTSEAGAEIVAQMPKINDEVATLTENLSKATMADLLTLTSDDEPFDLDEDDDEDFPE